METVANDMPYFSTIPDDATSKAARIWSRLDLVGTDMNIHESFRIQAAECQHGASCFFVCIGSACPSQHLEAPCEAIQEGRVLIVGSGISGLVAAVSLRHHGVLDGGCVSFMHSIEGVVDASPVDRGWILFVDVLNMFFLWYDS